MPDPSPGKLLVLLPGMGAVASTLIAGVELIRRGKKLPIGSLTQLGRFPVGRGRMAQERNGSLPPLFREIFPFASLQDLVFAGWDVLYRHPLEALEDARVLSQEDLREVAPYLEKIPVLPGYFQEERVPALKPVHTYPPGLTKKEVLVRLRREIQGFLTASGAERAVMVLLLSTETHLPVPESLQDPVALMEAVERDDPFLSPTILYTLAALEEGIPVINGTPNLCLELNALVELALRKGLCLAGKDLKTGQTLLKTAVAPVLKLRCLGVEGWFSTNILGNRDGQVLNHPLAFRSKEVTKTGVLPTILSPELYPELYENLYHKVRIEYYPPRGDAKEGWDNIDLFGWLGYPMQLKINFLCRDSILAAPVVLDLVLFLDLAQRLRERGLTPWLSFYFKEPLVPKGMEEEHDLFRQYELLIAQLERWLKGPLGVPLFK